MNWLTEVLERNGNSPNKVARQLLQHPDWPLDLARPQERSLGNRVRGLGRGELGWWRGDKGQQLLPLLAAVLDMSVADIELRTRRASAAVGGAYHYEVPGFPELRPIDLRSEDPFPGVPRASLRPWSWRRHWWTSGPGGGQEVVARWLEARRLARVVRAKRAGDLPQLQGGEREVFVLLADPAGPASWLDSWAGDGVRLLVCAPDAPVGPPEESGGMLRVDTWERDPGDWEELAVPDLAVWGRPLVRWVADRVAAGGGFDLNEALEMLDDGIEHLVSTPEEFIGVLGLLERLGAKRMEESEPSDWIRHYASIALEHRPENDPARRLLRKSGDSILKTIEVNRLVRGWPRSNRREQWVELAALAERPEADAELLLAALRDDATAEEKRAARTAIAGRPDVLVKALEEGRILAPADSGDLQLWPAWLAVFCQIDAVESVLGGPVERLAQAVLNVKNREALIEAALARLEKEGSTFLERALAAAGELAPLGNCAVTEFVFRVVGLGAAFGQQIDRSLLTSAWKGQERWAVKRYAEWPPTHRIGLTRFTSGLDSDAAYVLAAVAAAELLDREVTEGPLQELDPWHHELAEATGSLLHVASGLRLRDRELAEERTLAVYELGSRLLRALGQPIVHGQHVVDMQVPAELVRRAKGRGPLPTGWPLNPSSGLFAAIGAECERVGFALDDFLAWIWPLWVSNPGGWNWAFSRPAVSWTGEAPTGANAWTEEHLQRVWAVVPEGLLTPDLLKAIEKSEHLWRCLPARVWNLWVELVIDRQDQIHHEVGPWLHVPDDILAGAVRRGTFTPWDSTVLDALWRDRSELMMRLLKELRTEKPIRHPQYPQHAGHWSSLLWCVPDEHTAEAIGVAELALENTSDRVHLVGWLHRVVTERRRGWERAYEVMLTAEPPR